MLFLPYEKTLHEARLLQRRDRFLADVMLGTSKEQDIAYCVNPGRMEAFTGEGARVWLAPARVDEGKKGRHRRGLRWTWELIDHGGILCDTNTQRPNIVMGEVLRKRLLPGLDDWTELKSEKVVAQSFCSAPCEGGPSSKKFGFKVTTFPPASRIHLEDMTELGSEQAIAGRLCGSPCENNPSSQKCRPKATKRAPTSRIDFWLRHRNGQEHWIEVKNCHLVHPDGHAYFPDSVSLRARRHVEELQALVDKGCRCTVVFVVQREDLRGMVRPSDYHDPEFAKACRIAAEAGVAFRALKVSCSLEGLTVQREAKVDLEEYDPAPVARWAAANCDCTGWIRSLSNRRVANGPFPHQQKNVARAAAAAARPKAVRRTPSPKRQGLAGCQAATPRKRKASSEHAPRLCWKFAASGKTSKDIRAFAVRLTPCSSAIELA